jgi:hypothetical protein
MPKIKLFIHKLHKHKLPMKKMEYITTKHSATLTIFQQKRHEKSRAFFSAKFSIGWGGVACFGAKRQRFCASKNHCG